MSRKIYGCQSKVFVCVCDLLLSRQVARLRSITLLILDSNLNPRKMGWIRDSNLVFQGPTIYSVPQASQHQGCGRANIYSLGKSIRSELLVNIFGYINNITISTKNLCLKINYLHFLFFALKDPWVTSRSTQTIQTKIFHFYSLSAHNDIKFNVVILTKMQEKG